MTEEELVEKEREILAKYSDKDLHDYIAKASIMIALGEDTDGDFAERRRVCQDQLERRRREREANENESSV